MTQSKVALLAPMVVVRGGATWWEIFRHSGGATKNLPNDLPSYKQALSLHITSPSGI